jgi:uncharacterized coiled-coil protein SlyX
MPTLEDRVKKLEAASAYQDRQVKRMGEAIRRAAGQLAKLPTDATLQDVIHALQSAAGELRTLKDGDR